MLIRWATALILIPFIIYGALELPTFYLLFVTGGIFSLALWEWSNLANISVQWQRYLYLFFAEILMVVAWQVPPQTLMTLALIFWVFALLQMWKYPVGIEVLRAHPWLSGVIGYFVLIPCWAAINYLHSLSPAMLLIFLFLIWSSDSGAYLAGYFFGKHKLSPTISPKKTWEGLVGGVLMSLLFVTTGYFYFSLDMEMGLIWLALCWSAVLVGMLSDLYESMFKRIRNVKDSGALLPGHGGILDRLDSLTASAPFFVVIMILLKWI